MKHISYEEWMKYVKNELTDTVREVYDDHLYSCDQCLEPYLQAVDEYESELPVLSNEDEFTDLIMAQVKKAAKHEPEVSTPFYQKTFFHYAIAAAMTILFMSSGVFQSITKYVYTVQSSEITESTPSVTEEFVNKTLAWMDTIEIKNQEANN
jgi:hypothetical protein